VVGPASALPASALPASAPPASAPPASVPPASVLAPGVGVQATVTAAVMAKHQRARAQRCGASAFALFAELMGEPRRRDHQPNPTGCEAALGSGLRLPLQGSTTGVRRPSRVRLRSMPIESKRFLRNALRKLSVLLGKVRAARPGSGETSSIQMACSARRGGGGHSSARHIDTAARHTSVPRPRGKSRRGPHRGCRALRAVPRANPHRPSPYERARPRRTTSLSGRGSIEVGYARRSRRSPRSKIRTALVG
jgi:hypothetical protein